ncbi:MAG TPA: adenylate/guanylate cyclase domain-containing protein, partial [Thermodesulfobacteriota bacterium]|nr:adenylate/guanylate cyclase domain-containing protein [Thermodesulfobacteriota bacterium]
MTEKIQALKGQIEGEHREVTVMFCDLEGSTALTERLGDEKAFSLIDEIFNILTQQVHRYEGTIQEFRGDGIMALFGAPIAMENAAQRAVSASLAIHREVARFNNRFQEEIRGPSVRMRIGIHTGSVVLGSIGADLRLEFQVVGDTVNLAARIENLAEPGTTYVSEETFKLTDGFFGFEALGERRIKGKQSLFKVFRAMTASPLRTRFDVNAERGLTPFVGRRQELNLLFQGLEKVRRGKGKAFFISAEAGVGKSRLLYEFIRAVSNEKIIVLQGKCLSYGKKISYHLIQDILKTSLDIQETDPESEIREKVVKGLSVLGIDETSTLPFIMELLNVKDCGIEDISMSPEAKKVQILEAFKKVILKRSELHPLILVIEDLHWLDKSSEEIIKDFLHNIPQARVLLVCTYRPEFAPTWTTKSFCQQIILNRLSREESARIISYLLGLKKQEARLRDLLIDKTEGVPFFIEEFVKSLKDLKMVEMKAGEYRLADSALILRVPSTIQEVIMARVDSLPEGAKEVLQIGSVIEGEFGYKLLIKVIDIPEKDLVTRLSLLLEAELLYERGVPPSSTYIFGHAFTREVLYESIISTKRKELHGQVAEATEQLCDSTIEGNYGLLAHHYLIAENYKKAAQYHRLAAKKAEKMVSFPDAIFYAERRVMCIVNLPQTAETEKDLIDARTALGLYYININYHDRAKEVVEPVLQAAIGRSYDRRLA